MVSTAGTSKPRANPSLPRVILLSAMTVGIALLAWITLRRNAAADPLLSLSSPDARLHVWLADWQRNVSYGQEASPQRRAALSHALQDSDLPACTLVQIGREVHKTSDDALTTAIIYAAAVRKGNAELAPYSKGMRETRPILIALNSTRSMFWKVIDSGHREFLDPVHTLCDTLDRWIPEEDRELGPARPRAKIGNLSWLYSTGKTEMVLSKVGQVDLNALSQEDQLAVAWVHGLALYRAHRFPEAAEKFKFITAHPHFHHMTDAWKMLAVSLAHAGGAGGAKQASKEWSRRAPATAPSYEYVQDTRTAQ